MFWATTYTFDPDLFDQFVLRRMGDPPRNAVVLADQDRLSLTWDRIHREEPWRLRSANSRYLIRGLTAPRTFHPKTYLTADERRGSLFVGSGNLTLSGIERGHETFVRFDSDEGGMGAILAWSAWIEALISGLDEAVTGRWQDLKRTASWMRGDVPTPVPFVSNLSQPLLNQFVASLQADVDTLYLTAPFFDEHASALTAVIARVKPAYVRLYLCRKASVDGEALAQKLRGVDARVETLRYEADFVHAKLLAAVSSSGDGVVLSGSANLSSAALLKTGGQGGEGNIEAGVLTTMPQDEIEARFEPASLPMTLLDLSALSELKFRPSETPAGDGELRLLFARYDEEDHVEIGMAEGSNIEGQRLAYEGGAIALDGMKSAEPLPGDRQDAIVWLVNGDGELASNSVSVDDPRALKAELADRGGHRNRPRELDLSDVETPVGELLVRLQAECVFDLDEVPKPTTETHIDGKGGADDDDDLWERLQREELALDPRIAAYRTFSAAGRGVDDPILLQLEAMLGEVAAKPKLRSVHPGGGNVTNGGNGEGPERSWSPESRLRVRLFNVLKRWSVALADPRFFWISPAAGVRNFIALLYALTECWRKNYLPEDRVRDLIEALMASFIQGERSRGYLWLLEDDERSKAIDAVTEEAREVADALVYAVFRDTTIGHPYIFDWQVFLAPGLDLGLFRCGDSVPALVESLCGYQCSCEEVKARLEEVATYVNDERWCDRTRQGLQLEVLSLHVGHFRDATFLIRVADEIDLLTDTRMPRLAREALEYRRTESTVIVEAGGSTRLRVERDGKVGIVKGGEVKLLARELTWSALLRLDAMSRPFADLVKPVHGQACLGRADRPLNRA